MTIDLPELVSVPEADVYKQGALAARLSRTAQGVAFRYLDEYLDADGPAVATTLPKTRPTVLTPAGGVPPYFAGLLPEGRRLAALRRNIKTSADDDLSILLAVGSDLIGDVQVMPSGQPPAEVSAAVTADLSQVRFAEIFAQSVGTRPDRIGIPGVQEKVSARMISVPVIKQAKHFILKLNPPEFRHLVENEEFFLRAAAKSGLAVVEAALVHDAAGESGLLIQRFDRLADGTRLAVEDGCQLLGRYPADKYAISSATMISALSDVCQARLVAARDLLRQLVFAFLTGNGDAHAKNFAVLSRGGKEWRVSPAYDLPTSLVYPNLDASMALSIGGKRGDDLSGKDFQALGESAGVPPKATAKVISEICQRADLWLPQLTDLPFDRGRLGKLRRTIELRRSRLLRLG